MIVPFQCKLVITELMHRHLLCEKHSDQPQSSNGNHHLPYNRHAGCKRCTHLISQRFRETFNLGYDSIRDFHTLWELGAKIGGQEMLELILEDCSAYSDPPGL